MILENTLVSYANDLTLSAEVPKPSNRVAAVSSLNRDLPRNGDWYKCYGRLVYPIKTKALEMLRARTLAPIFPNLLLDGIVVKKGDRLN